MNKKMKNRNFTAGLCFLLFVLFALPARGQQAATIKEFKKEMTTYPFSDPNPIPVFGKIYPYFRYDGFTDQAQKKEWTIVELENPYIRVQLTPEIGGKVWSAYDKVNQKPFFYENDVVKFRDIAMRGPWTSGGLEANFGIIGHTPTVATPVNYYTAENKDGSVSCYISSLDLLTRTKWVVEVRLPKDRAYFETRVFWYNPSSVEKPYYSWMNLAVKAREDLHFIDPGTHYIGHNGEAHPWPEHPERQRDLSLYRNNNFGGSKSYHILGKYARYFGAFYEDDNYGMIHTADRDDKLGKKVFLWALSDAGKIWESLLTDNAGQYTEIQSGRLFNQNVFSSSSTPFKQLGFAPGQTDYWQEYWFPFQNTGGVSHADRYSVLSATMKGRQLSMELMAVSPLKDSLYLYDTKGSVLHKQAIDLKPMENMSYQLDLEAGDSLGKIVVGKTHFIPDWEADKSLERPVESPQEYNAGNAYGQYLLGRDAYRFRQYDRAEKHITRALDSDPFLVPARVELAKLYYRKMEYDKAFEEARSALRIDTYNPAANYYYGLAADKLGRPFDAADGWEVAAQTPSYRAAAWQALAIRYVKQGQWTEAQDYISKSLSANPKNIETLQIQYLLNRIGNAETDNESIAQRITALDPLNHFIRFEKYFQTKQQEDLQAFKKYIRNELPAQTYLELALWYHRLGRTAESREVLEAAPVDNLIHYWMAYLHRGTEDFDQLLAEAEQGSAEMVFPFRSESATMLQWMMDHTDDWKPRYYMALLQASRGNDQKSETLLSSLSNDISFAPLYAVRSRYQASPDERIADLKRAIKEDEASWRYKQQLAAVLKNEGAFDEALNVLEPYYSEHPENYMVGMDYVQLLLVTGQIKKSEKVMASIHILPYEGASEGRRLYRATKLLLAIELLEAGDEQEALQKLADARKWPYNLGVGKPFPDMIDEEWENQLEKYARQQSGGQNVSQSQLEEIRQAIMARYLTINGGGTPFSE
ncbi:DUF5107 domain-containing protein [Fodinibius sediminis]|nr:DUF5107 domain-containing protein [Fodinibius sediminis]